MKMYGIILAGGSGSRLWPLSRELYPKQLINLNNGESLLQSTFKRLNAFIGAGNIISVTNIKHSSSVKLQLNQISDENIVLAEPVGKNTAPAIATTLEYIRQKVSDNEIVIIVPSDHLIKDIEAFEKTVLEGARLASLGYLVTFGVKPSYPETGYGYIKTSSTVQNGFEVERFVEKPDLQTAKEYLKSNDYFWNCGIFMGKVSTFLNEFATLAPEIYNNLSSLDFSTQSQIDYSVYEAMPSISVDYAIMEKSDKIALIELKSDWSDLGSWQSLYDIKDKDENGNVTEGNVILNDVKNSFIYSSKKLVAASGLEDVIIVETEDAVMACKKEKSQDIKKIYDELKSREDNTYIVHKTVFRPWGYYTCLAEGEGYLTKVISVSPNQKLSIQSHNHRSEHWVVLEGKALVVLDGKEHYLNPGQSIDIAVEAKHSLQNPYDEKLKIIEVQKGNYISEDDIIRYEDIYGRI
jgi:mannose-1-phosphate guanylyltransferase/mannose-6-phosphate isomerase